MCISDSFPNTSPAGDIMSGSIDFFNINIHLTQFSSIHAAADIDADDIRNRFIGDCHCGADRAALSGMYIRLNTPSGMVPSGRNNGAHRTGIWCRLTAWMVHGHTASV